MRIGIIALGAVGIVAVASVSASAAPIDDKQATAILTKGGCTICHTVDKKLIGPSYAEVSKKYKGEKDAAAAITKKVRDGSTGVFGPIPMPPNPVAKISDADLKAIVEWVLSK